MNNTIATSNSPNKHKIKPVDSEEFTLGEKYVKYAEQSRIDFREILIQSVENHLRGNSYEQAI